MHLNIIDGSFEKADALDILEKFIDVKIRFHEDKIQRSHNEEDIKMRERRIQALQKDLFELRNYIPALGGMVSLKCALELNG